MGHVLGDGVAMARQNGASSLSGKSIKQLAKELIRIRAEHKALTPRAVVADAAHPSSPLHKYFDWDDTSAAQKYRLEQASSLIGACRVLVTLKSGDEKMVPKFVNVVVKDVRQYLPREQVAKSANLSLQVVQSAREALESWESRYHTIVELFPAATLVKKAIGTIKTTGGQSL